MSSQCFVNRCVTCLKCISVFLFTRAHKLTFNVLFTWGFVLVLHIWWLNIQDWTVGSCIVSSSEYYIVYKDVANVCFHSLCRLWCLKEKVTGFNWCFHLLTSHDCFLNFLTTLHCDFVGRSSKINRNKVIARKRLALNLFCVELSCDFID